MAKTFKVPLTGVTWKMLDKVKHQPIVIVKLCDE
jgi:F420-0:gamma-glutamyl ligase-like protein